MYKNKDSREGKTVSSSLVWMEAVEEAWAVKVDRYTLNSFISHIKKNELHSEQGNM